MALSLGSPPAGVTRRLFAVEPGLSSTFLRSPRPPGHLIRLKGAGLGEAGQGAGSFARDIRISSSHDTVVADSSSTMSDAPNRLRS